MALKTDTSLKKLFAVYGNAEDPMIKEFIAAEESPKALQRSASKKKNKLKRRKLRNISMNQTLDLDNPAVEQSREIDLSVMNYTTVEYLAQSKTRDQSIH